MIFGDLDMTGTLKSCIEFLRSSKKRVLLIVIVVVITIFISAIISTLLEKAINLYVPTTGTVKTLGVEAYWDRNLKNKTEEISWRTIWVGSSRNVTFYVQSISNIETTLFLNTANWNPTNISDYMNLSWNYNGTTLNPSEAIQVTLTLTASSSNSFILYLTTSDVKEFSFDIIISTSEYSSKPIALCVAPRRCRTQVFSYL